MLRISLIVSHVILCTRNLSPKVQRTPVVKTLNGFDPFSVTTKMPGGFHLCMMIMQATYVELEGIVV